MLEGNALSVYMEMDDVDKKKACKVKNRLREAFGMDPFTAYELLKTKHWNGEQIDVYVTELRKLVRIAGLSETAVKRAFITGLPSNVSKELRSLPDVEKMKLSNILCKARSLMSSHLQ